MKLEFRDVWVFAAATWHFETRIHRRQKRLKQQEQAAQLDGIPRSQRSRSSAVFVGDR